MSQLRANYIELEGSIQKVMDNFVKKNEDLPKIFFDVASSTRSQENHLSMGTRGLMTKWNGQVNYTDIEKGYKNEYRHEKYSDGTQIERELFDDEEFKEVKKRANSLSYGVVKTLNFHAVQPFEYGNSTFKSADGVSLFNTAHHIVPGDDAQSNISTTYDLNVDNLEAVIKAMSEFKDDKGHPMMVQPRMIIAGEYWRKTAKQLLGSEKEAYTADNQINVYKDMTYYCTPWITGKKWFVVDPVLMKNGNGLNWYMRRDPRKVEYEDDFDTEVGKYKVVGRWSYGSDSWYYAFGCYPA